MKLLRNLNQYRVRDLEAKMMGMPLLERALLDESHDDYFGCFQIKLPGHPKPIRVIASRFRDNEPESMGNPMWNHVSVSYPNRTPTWGEMCAIKDLFFEPFEVVMQLHPAEEDYVNNHAYCLHLWQPASAEIPLPPSWMVGVQSLGTINE